MIFKVKDGSYGYGKESFFNDLSFEVKEGEVLAVLGANGVGKTTLLKCMMGLKEWKKGQSLIDDVPIQKMSHKDVWKQIGYVAQAKNVGFTYSAREMILLGRSAHLGIFSQPKEEDLKVAEEVMEMVGITHLADKHCNQMSGGQLQMVLIARALAAKPKLLVLDEPESNLDFKNQLVILDLIEKLSKTYGISCIINTHYPAHALRVADKALILSQNKEWFYGNAQEMINSENMKKAFGERVAIEKVAIEKSQFTYVFPISFAN